MSFCFFMSFSVLREENHVRRVCWGGLKCVLGERMWRPDLKALEVTYLQRNQRVRQDGSNFEVVFIHNCGPLHKGLEGIN